MAQESSTSSARTKRLVPAPWALLGFALLCTVAVLDLPSLSSSLRVGDGGRPNAVPSALTGAAVLLFTAGYLTVAAGASGLPRKWVLLTFAYCAGIAVIKFGVSPTSFESTSGTTLGDYVKIGIVVMLLYCAALWAIEAVARRTQPRRWSASSKLMLLSGILIFALVSRYLAALAMGTGADDYLGEVFQGTGLFLLVLLAVVAAVAIESFDTLARLENGASLLPTALVTGLSIIVTYHGIWALYMVRQFD